MKKVLVFLIVLFIITGCNKKIVNNDNNSIKEIEDDSFVIESLDSLISYKMLDDYVEGDTYYLSDFNEESTQENKNNVIVEKYYESKKSYGYFSALIFSYKNKDIFPENNSIDENDYINNLVKKTTMTIDNHQFTIGYSGEDDLDDVIGRAYVRHNDYVFLFSMSNSDDPITEEQYNEFIKIISSIKFLK
jgi:hypothetical protein